jgi:hypothetical protein
VAISAGRFSTGIGSGRGREFPADALQSCATELFVALPQKDCSGGLLERCCAAAAFVRSSETAAPPPLHVVVENGELCNDNTLDKAKD